MFTVHVVFYYVFDINQNILVVYSNNVNIAKIMYNPLQKKYKFAWSTDDLLLMRMKRIYFLSILYNSTCGKPEHNEDQNSKW